MSRGLQDIVANPNLCALGKKIASDSAFPINARCAGRIITSLNEDDLDRVAPDCRLGLQAMSDSITSLRQAAEWGMGTAVKVYRQLILPLPYNPHVRGRRLVNIFRQCNFKVRRTGISEIKNLFQV